ncbi:MAG: hypothetical protein ACRCWF_13980 [Beijerinckiaceae bacterium]
MRIMRLVKRLAVVGLVLGVVAAIPIARNELSCMDYPQSTKPYEPLLPQAARRNGVDTLLTYPEWSIVHAYEDFAGVIRTKGESQFGYWQSVSGFWTSLCNLSRTASRQGAITSEMKAMLYIIGISFSGEMAVKGLYETTLGRLTEWIRGETRTPEDNFAIAMADDYAAFLRQTPWYEYPFLTSLKKLWSGSEPGATSIVRSVERRIALSMELGVKSVYAKAIGALAGAVPAKLTIDTIITGMSREALSADPAVTIKGEMGGGLWVETPRYRAYTEFVQRVAKAGGGIREIAGNDRIFITTISRANAGAPAGANVLVNVPLQAKTGYVRIGEVVPVAQLTDKIRQLEQAGASFEHAYDY